MNKLTDVINEKDRLDLEKVMQELKQKNISFYDQFGITDNEMAIASVRQKEFADEMRKPGEGNSPFYNTPLARKAFIVGFVSGMREIPREVFPNG